MSFDFLPWPGADALGDPAYGGDPGAMGGGFPEPTATPEPLAHLLSSAGAHLLPVEGTPTGLVMSVGGVDYDVPDPDGLDAATFADERGMTILSDLDGDGRVDYISDVTFDGQWTAWRMGGGEAAAGSAAPSGSEIVAGAVAAGDAEVVPAPGDGVGAGPEAAAGELGPESAEVPSSWTDTRWAGSLPRGEGRGEGSVGGTTADFGAAKTPGSDLGTPGSTATPEHGRQTWDKTRWECVERGEWG